MKSRFRHGLAYQLTPDAWDDGTVMVDMPHAPHAGRAKFDEKQWWEWWVKVK